MNDSAKAPFLVAVGALIGILCVLVGVFVSQPRSEHVSDRMLNYPDTGFVPLRRLRTPSNGEVKQATHNSIGQPNLFDLAYEDKIHPDEDLLLPPGSSPTVDSPLGLMSREPVTADFPPPTELDSAVTNPFVVTKPNPNSDLPSPSTFPSNGPSIDTDGASDNDSSLPIPQAGDTGHSPQSTVERGPALPLAPASDSFASGDKRFDPNRPPAPDEDLLLQNISPGTSDSPEVRQPASPRVVPDSTVPVPVPFEKSPPNQPNPPITSPAEPVITPRPDPPLVQTPASEPSRPERIDPPKTEPTPIEVLPDRPQLVMPDQRRSVPQEPRTLPHVPAPHSTAASPSSDYSGPDPHLEVFAKSTFPSAKECRECHETIYEEWASSSHAYASISPMFQKFEQAINSLAKGTVGYFCLRCHAPVATTLNHERHLSIYDSIPSATEGVTCVACHRVAEEYGKVNGERRVEMGSINDPMYGSGYGEGLAEVLAKKEHYKVKTGPHEKGPGQQIHNRVIHFEQLSSSHFCVSCHQVAVAPGIALEVVWAQYRASPAHKQGIECQECHMGQEPGVAQGYTTGPVAVINGKEVSPHRKHSNHMFFGPGYSIAHPGTFPKNPDADEWSMEEWLQFDYRSGWGTERFEELLEDNKVHARFPKAWENSDDRMDAREIVDANLQKLEAKRQMRHRLMENGSHLEGPIFARQPRIGKPLKFHYVVTNTNLGHNMPSGSLGAQPQIWINVALTGPGGQHLWESGYVDRNGDLADMHSLEVAAGRIRPDQQLFNLQTKFLITHVKGTDREIYLPVNTDIDQLPFIRPSAFPITVMNHPPFIRMEGHSLPPLGSRNASYKVPRNLVQAPGNYRLSVRMRSRAEPIYFMRYCNATPEMERNMNEWMLDYHEDHYDFYVAP